VSARHPSFVPADAADRPTDAREQTREVENFVYGECQDEVDRYDQGVKGPPGPDGIGVDMKFLLSMHMNPAVWDALTPEERDEIGNGHGAFIDLITTSGEMITTQALIDPSQSVVVRVRDGQQVVTDGPYLEAKEHLGGFYLIDCDSKERAIELAALIPDAKVDGLGIEVRQVMYSNGHLEA
jgi:hypothetical protein